MSKFSPHTYYLRTEFATCLKVSFNLSPPELGCVRISDIEVPSSEQLVAKVDGFTPTYFNIALVVGLTHPVHGDEQLIDSMYP